MRQDPKLLLVQEVLDRTWKEERHFDPHMQEREPMVVVVCV